MPPPRNVQRREQLTDAAIEVLGARGIHQLSHRAVDDAAGLPAGTTTNYFKTRDDLLVAAAGRIAELQLADMAAAADPAAPVTGVDDLTALLGRSMYEGATRHRSRLLAIYELSLEATRRPVLLNALSSIAAASLGATVGQHRELGLASSPQQVQALITLYGGTLFALVTAPPEAVTQEGVNALAGYIVRGVLSELP
ncbi:MAG TPA: TetR family transcriptional regulator [Trebonia sp.]|nr:TetR family transcriptional regulator [Trebonia sp.]